MNNDNKWQAAVGELIEQINSAYTYHHKMESKHVGNTSKWLLHSDAKAQCENLTNQIEEILQKHGLSLEECEHRYRDVLKPNGLTVPQCTKCGAERTE